jgi:hypothetical protein
MFDKDPEKSKDNDVDILHPTTTHGEGTVRRASIVDDVFGEITEDGPNYRAVRQPPRDGPNEEASLTLRRWDGRRLPC